MYALSGISKKEHFFHIFFGNLRSKSSFFFGLAITKEGEVLQIVRINLRIFTANVLAGEVLAYLKDALQSTYAILTKRLSFITGGNGYINDYPTGRFLRDAKLYEIGAGTSEIRRMLIGRKINDEFAA